MLIYITKACSTGQTEFLRLMVPDSSNQMMSLAGSGFKMEEDQPKIEIVDSSGCYNASTLLIFVNM